MAQPVKKEAIPVSPPVQAGGVVHRMITDALTVLYGYLGVDGNVSAEADKIIAKARGEEIE